MATVSKQLEERWAHVHSSLAASVNRAHCGDPSVCLSRLSLHRHLHEAPPLNLKPAETCQSKPRQHLVRTPKSTESVPFSLFAVAAPTPPLLHPHPLHTHFSRKKKKKGEISSYYLCRSNHYRVVKDVRKCNMGGNCVSFQHISCRTSEVAGVAF